MHNSAFQQTAACGTFSCCTSIFYAVLKKKISAQWGGSKEWIVLTLMILSCPLLLAPDQYQSKNIYFTNLYGRVSICSQMLTVCEQRESYGTYCCYYERWKLSSCLQSKKRTGSHGQKTHRFYSALFKSRLFLTHTHTQQKSFFS